MTSIRTIQFIHPGKEHVISKRHVKNGVCIYDWNGINKQHKRKFIKASGQYLDSNNKIQNDFIYFWGEWEPWSKVSLLHAKPPQGDYPRCVHEPIYYSQSAPPSYCHRRGKNTDPFVFGDHFLYSLCQQYRKTGPTKLNWLSPGSLILFGSCMHPRTTNSYFALDTIFVVGERHGYKPADNVNNLDPYFSIHYNKIMGFKGRDLRIFTAYKGASYNSPFEGMYSFVPCKVGESGINGFERAKLTNADLSFITNNLTQGFKAKDSTISNNLVIWNTVRDIIHRQGFYEGVRMDYMIR